MARSLAAAALLLAAALPTSMADMKCVACNLVFTLMEQPANGSLPTGGNPDLTCQLFGLCDGSCPMFAGNAWPVASPNFPTDGGAVDQRRRLVSKHMRLGHKGKGKVATTAAEPLQGMNMPSVEEAVAFVREFGAATEGKKVDFFGVWKEVSRFFLTHHAKVVSQVEGGRALLGEGPCNDASNITCDISRVFDNHLPLFDADNDLHAPAPASFVTDGFRGGDWRGRDCNDGDATVYPGRSATTQGPAVDHNCNGIFGGNASIPDFEAAFCSGANAPLGVAILGDSAAAHFHLPPQYLNKQTFNLSGLLEAASNELDWPQCSWSTGFRETDGCPASHGVPMNSIYQRVRELNLCSHRDYQNMGVNGARTGSMAPPGGIVTDYQRNQAADAPALVFYALIGNDVCNGHPGMSSMTTVAEFQTNVMSALVYLDTVLPKGSHVAFLGLADGRVLWDTTNTRTHPLGISYPDLYEYLACNGATPCWGWMNANETWRNATSERAAQLTAVYDTIIATNGSSFANFDMYRVDVDWFALIGDYAKTGADPMNIIEPVDGFHPSQTGQQLLADIIWTDLQTNRPQWLPSANPFNSDIVTLFGDQGGY